MNWIAGYVLWTSNDRAKLHALDPDVMTNDPVNRVDAGTARCGAKHVTPTVRKQPFGSVIKFEQCQRCVALLEKDAAS
jgi:hypothetical protein